MFEGCDWLKQQLTVTDKQIPEIALKTEGQRNNPLGAAVHKLRFTASNFGLILAAVAKNRQVTPIFHRHTIIK